MLEKLHLENKQNVGGCHEVGNKSQGCVVDGTNLGSYLIKDSYVRGVGKNGCSTGRKE
jgi:hypothetical protein